MSRNTLNNARKQTLNKNVVLRANKAPLTKRIWFDWSYLLKYKLMTTSKIFQIKHCNNTTFKFSLCCMQRKIT